MKTSLIKSAIIVFCFWWLVLFVITPYNGVYMIQAITRSLGVSVVGALCGVALAYLLIWNERQRVKETLEPSNFRGMNINIGTLPEIRKPQRAKNIDVPDEFQFWYEQYSEKHPKHAALLNAVIAIYKYHNLPASPVKGGHGGASLMRHSFNVLREIMAKAPGYEFNGIYSKASGKLLKGLDDPDYKFNPDDPVIPLIGFIHDLGKVRCYQPDGKGGIIDKIPNHDIQGGKLLITIDEFWSLSDDDRDVINMAVSHYHHPIAMPLWVSDRTRAVTELLIIADNAAGRKEGGVFYKNSKDALNTESVDADDEDGDPKVISGDDMFEYLRDILAEPERINGGNKAMRVAMKSNGFLFIEDHKFRAAVAEASGMSAIGSMPMEGSIHPCTENLLSKLIEMDLLMNTFKGLTFSSKRALFNTEGVDNNGKKLFTCTHTIIVKASVFDFTEQIKDCPVPLEVIKPAWGLKSAKNKKESLEAQEAGEDVQSSIDSSKQKEAELTVQERNERMRNVAISNSIGSLDIVMPDVDEEFDTEEPEVIDVIDVSLNIDQMVTEQQQSSDEPSEQFTEEHQAAITDTSEVVAEIKAEDASGVTHDEVSPSTQDDNNKKPNVILVDSFLDETVSSLPSQHISNAEEAPLVNEEVPDINEVSDEITHEDAIDTTEEPQKNITEPHVSFNNTQNPIENNNEIVEDAVETGTQNAKNIENEKLSEITQHFTINPDDEEELSFFDAVSDMAINQVWFDAGDGTKRKLKGEIKPHLGVNFNIFLMRSLSQIYINIDWEKYYQKILNAEYPNVVVTDRSKNGEDLRFVGVKQIKQTN